MADPNGQVRVNPTGNPGMATGGTGDVLSGIVGALPRPGPHPARRRERRGCSLTDWPAMPRPDAGDGSGRIASDLITALGEVWTAWGR